MRKQFEKRFAALALAALLMLALAACGQKAAVVDWLPENWLDGQVRMALIDFTHNEVTRAHLKLRTDENTQRNVQWSAGDAAPNVSDLTKWDDLADLVMPMTASQLEPFAKACVQWMQENYPEDARFDVTYVARDEQTLAADAAEALNQEVRLVYSIGGENLWELSGELDAQSVLGLGDLAIQRADGTQRVNLFIME